MGASERTEIVRITGILRATAKRIRNAQAGDTDAQTIEDLAVALEAISRRV